METISSRQYRILRLIADGCSLRTTVGVHTHATIVKPSRTDAMAAEPMNRKTFVAMEKHGLIEPGRVSYPFQYWDISADALSWVTRS